VSVDFNTAAAVALNAKYFPDTVAVVYDGGDLNYRELEDRSARLAAVLLAEGIEADDRVAYVGMNSSAFVVAMLATFRIGAIYVPVNFRLAGPELAQVLGSSRAKMVIAEEGHRAAVESVRAETSLERFLLVDDDQSCPVGEGDVLGWSRWAPLLEQATPLQTIRSRTAEDIALLMFTSGTTGLPKGVILTYGNVWWNAVNVDSRLDSRRGDVTYAAAPLFHIGALNSFALRMLARGGTLVIRRTFDPVRFVSDISTLRVNSTFMVPAMLAAMARVPGVFENNFSSLRAVVVAGAPVPPSLIEDFATQGVTLQQAWGLTETAPFATHLPAEMTLTKLGSAGIPMPHTELKVLDLATDTDAGPGVAGELLVRGPNVSPGYWENPEATADAFDSDGWFHSGDIGYLDEDGFLFIVDRLKDMVISGGENVYPAEVERSLADMPGVTDVAVVGIPDPEWGETVVAVVSLAEDATLDLDAVREFAASRIARYKLPRRLQIVQAVPRNASGKLDKVAIRQSLEHQ
jgi:fatty-acyl-CoA synthase